MGWSSHAVQLINGNFIIAYSIRDRPDLFLISELSSNGMTFIRSFDPRRIEANRLDDWTPFHVSIDEDQNIFIADRNNDRVVRLNSRLTGFQILLNRDQHSIELPRRSVDDQIYEMYREFSPSGSTRCGPSHNFETLITIED